MGDNHADGILVANGCWEMVEAGREPEYETIDPIELDEMSWDDEHVIA